MSDTNHRVELQLAAGGFEALGGLAGSAGAQFTYTVEDQDGQAEGVVMLQQWSIPTPIDLVRGLATSDMEILD